MKQAYDQADEAKRLINGLIAYLRGKGQNSVNKISDQHADDFISSEKSDDLNLDDLPDNEETTDN